MTTPTLMTEDQFRMVIRRLEFGAANSVGASAIHGTFVMLERVLLFVVQIQNVRTSCTTIRKSNRDVFTKVSLVWLNLRGRLLVLDFFRC